MNEASKNKTEPERRRKYLLYGAVALAAVLIAAAVLLLTGCPSCRAWLRVPRGKGKLNITCRQCGERFTRNT